MLCLIKSARRKTGGPQTGPPGGALLLFSLYDHPPGPRASPRRLAATTATLGAHRTLCPRATPNQNTHPDSNEETPRDTETAGIHHAIATGNPRDGARHRRETALCPTGSW